MRAFPRVGFLAFFALGLLWVGPARAALEVESNPGSNTSPTGTVSVQDDVIDFPQIPLLVINRIAKFVGRNASGFSGVYCFRSSDSPAIGSFIGATQFTFFQDNNGVKSFLNGAVAGDDN